MKSNKIKSLKTEGKQAGKSLRKGMKTLSLGRLNTVVTQKLAKGYKYDSSLFHKTIFHLKPVGDNPQHYAPDISLSTNALNNLKYTQIMHEKAIIPHPILVKLGTKNASNKQKMLLEGTFSHVTAKKWLIYNMAENLVIKGYKYRTRQDVASLSKMLTFYTVYDIIKENFIVANSFEILVLPIDNKVGGSMVRINHEQECLITLQDALYALLMASANNIAVAIANNLGSYLNKISQKKYFSCFDLQNQSRENNIKTFMNRMHSLALALGLKDSDFSNPHGASGNTSSAFDMAKLASQCFKIPLFSKISNTKRYVIKTKEIDIEGDILLRSCLLDNTNRLIGREGCVGGKTGSNKEGGQSFLGAFLGSVVIVVLGCAGREEKFHDCLRLWEWCQNKLLLSQLMSK